MLSRIFQLQIDSAPENRTTLLGDGPVWRPELAAVASGLPIQSRTPTQKAAQDASPSELNPSGHRKSLAEDLGSRQSAELSDLRLTYTTKLSAGGVADEWVTQMLRQEDAQAFKKYSEMKLPMKREALEKINRQANEMQAFGTPTLGTVMLQ